MYDEFMLLLRERASRWAWWIEPGGAIRSESMEGDEVDPITAMAAEILHVLYPPGEYLAAARRLGLDDASADAIAQAVDLADSYNAHVRADLADALGISEQWGRIGRWNDTAWHRSPYPHQYDRPFRRGSG